MSRARLEPEAVISDMEALLETAPDVEARLVARYAIGMATRTQLDLPKATAQLADAATDARALGYGSLAGRMLTSLAGAIAMGGDPARGAEVATDALQLLEGADAIQGYVQVASLHAELGEYGQAANEFEEALQLIRQTGERLDQLPLLYNNYGSILLSMRRFHDSHDAFARGWDEIAHNRSQTTNLLSHLGLVSGLLGDTVESLQWFRQIAGTSPDPGWRIDYGTVLRGAGLRNEAFEQFRTAVATAVEAGLPVREFYARLQLVWLLTSVGDLPAASAQLEQAASAGEDARLELGHVRLLEAWVEINRNQPDSLERAESLLVDATGFMMFDLLVALAYRWARWGESDRARSALARLPDEVPARQEVLRQTTHAVLAAARGDDSLSLDLVSAAVELAELHRGVLGSTDLRALSQIGAEARQLELALAIAADDSAGALIAADRFRGHQPSSKTAELDEQLALYRLALRRSEDEELSAESHTDLIQAERQLRDTARLGSLDAHLSTNLDAESLAQSLKDTTLVEFAHADDDVVAIVVDSDGLRLVPIPEADIAERRLDGLDIAISRLRSQPGDWRAFDTMAAELDRVFVQPWLNSARDIVISPEGMLNAIPWGALPSLRSRDVAVTPSARRLTRARRTPPPGQLLVAGPDLEHADREIELLVERFDSSVSLTGKAATVSAVNDAMSGVGLAHIAAHGVLRSDNPMFSYLQLVDGPLNLYDVEQLGVAPHTVVLSSCSVGSSVGLTGPNSLGLATSFLSMGTECVVASLFEVDDAATAEVMDGFHAALTETGSASAALARVRMNLGGPSRLAALSFQAYR